MDIFQITQIIPKPARILRHRSAKNTLVYADLDDFSGVSRAFETISSSNAKVIECNSSSKLDDTYLKDIYSMYPVFF